MKRGLFTCLICVASLQLVLANCAWAADSSGKTADSKDATPAGQSGVGLLVPDSPAFTILGVNPQKVTKPASPKELALSLLNGVDGQGNVQSGFALDFVPYLMAAGDYYTIDEYRKGGIRKILANTSLSAAAVKGTGDADKSAKAAFGLRTTLFDLGDPREDLALQKCLSNAFAPPASGDGPPTGFSITTSANASKAWDGCKKESRARLWNGSAFEIGAGWSAQSPDGSTSSFKSGTWGAYASLGYGFEKPFSKNSIPSKNSYIVFHAEYLGNQSIANKTTPVTYFKQDSFSGAMQYTYGLTPDFHLSVAGSITDNMPSGKPDVVSYSISVGPEFKISDGLWISLAVGGQSKTAATTGASSFVLSQLKYSLFDQEPELPSVQKVGH